MMTTPTEIGDSVNSLRKAAGLAEEAVWVDVQSRKDSIPNDCYKDVERQVKQFGGSLVYGWQVWEWPGVMVEGEFHAVWKNAEGELVDVTRKVDGEQKIVFIPDPNRRYEEKQIDNIRFALWGHALVQEYIKVNQQIHRHFDENRVSELESNVNLEEMMNLQNRKAAIQAQLMAFPRGRGKGKFKNLSLVS